MQAAKQRRMESQEVKDKKNLLYLLKPDLLRTYHENELNKAKILQK